MTDLDELIREALSRDAGRARFDSARWEPSVTRLPTPRTPRFPSRGPIPRAVLGVAVAALLAAAILWPIILLSRLGSGPLERAPGSDQSPTPTAHVRHADRDDGLSISVPASWTFHQDPSGPAEPRTIFAVGSYAFSTGGECAPAFAQRELPADGALFWLIEWQDPTFAFPVRPSSFELDESTHGFYECSVTSSYLIRFEDQGRYFQVHVSLGESAPGSAATEVLSALESLEVTAPVPEGCPPEVAASGDPDCPESAWIHAIIEGAGYGVTGSTGSALIGEAGHAEFGMHVTEADSTDPYVVPPERGYDERIYRPHITVDDRTVYTDGIRLVWTVQGFHIWVGDGVGEPIALKDLEVLVRASLTVDYDSIDTRS
jgi:hypothetical protein